MLWKRSGKVSCLLGAYVHGKEKVASTGGGRLGVKGSGTRGKKGRAGLGTSMGTEGSALLRPGLGLLDNFTVFCSLRFCLPFFLYF